MYLLLRSQNHLSCIVDKWIIFLWIAMKEMLIDYVSLNFLDKFLFFLNMKNFFVFVDWIVIRLIIYAH